MGRDYFRQFQSRKRRIVELGRQLAALAKTVSDAEAARVLADFMGRFTQNRFLLLVVGDFKSGKSTLVNALVARSICPVRATPRTAKVTRLAAAGSTESERIEVAFREDRKAESHPLRDGALDDLVAVGGKRVNEVQLVDVYLHAGDTLLRNPIRIVDTPGLGSGESEHSASTRDYLQHADAVLFVFSASKPYSETERDFLLSFRSLLDRTVFAVNRIDEIPHEERDEVLEHIRSRLLRDVLAAGSQPPKLHQVSALEAINASTTKNAELRERSGLPSLICALEERLAGGLALNLLTDVVTQQEIVCSGLQERGRLALDSLSGAEKIAETRRPQLTQLRNDLSEQALRWSRAIEGLATVEAEILVWGAERVTGMRDSILKQCSKWLESCSSEDVCKREFPGVAAKIVADQLDSLDLEVASRLRTYQDAVDVQLRNLFDSMESATRNVMSPASKIGSAASLSNHAAALSRLAALAGGIGGPTEGYGLATAALSGALAPSRVVRFFSIAAAVSILLATLGGPVGWVVAGVASFFAVLLGFDHALTWKQRVLTHVTRGVDERVIPATLDRFEESARGFFVGLASEAEVRAIAFRDRLLALIADVDRDLAREASSRRTEISRLQSSLKHLSEVYSELRSLRWRRNIAAAETRARKRPRKPK